MTDEWVARAPAPALRPYVDGYIGYRRFGAAPALHRGLPSRHVTCIVSIGEPIEVVAHTDRRQPPGHYSFVLSGLQAAPALIARRATEAGVAVLLTPLGFRALCGAPVRDLWDTTVEAADAIGPAARELWERLQTSAGWEQRVRLCDEVLGRLITGAPEVRSELLAAWQILVDSGGVAPVADVAGEVGWSRQHLASRFADEFGLSPKLAARVIRFERARVMLQRAPRAGLAAVAAACGYYDQAHLNLDFAAFAGCSPTHWMREELPSFQDGTGACGAESAA